MTNHQSLRVSMATFAPGWNFELIPAAHEKVRQGYEIESWRLKGSRFIAVMLRQEFDYDGLSEDVLKLGGFAELEEAQRFADWEVRRQIKAEHAKPGRDSWQRTNGGSALPKALHRPASRLSDGTGYNSCYITVGIFPAGEARALDGAVITAINHNWELARYFQDVAKLHP